MFKNDNGFTLMEVLIAITILSFIMVSIITIQDNSQTTKDRVLSEDRDWLQVETAFSRLEWDFSQIFSPLYYSHEMRIDETASEEEQEVFNMMSEPYVSNENFGFPSYDAHPVPIFKQDGKDTIEFFTTSNRRKFKNIKQSNFAWVRYTVESLQGEDGGDSTKALVRYFFPDDPFNPDPIRWDRLKGQVLLRNVEKIKFEYWNRETRKWVDNFDLVKDGRHKILGLRVILDWLDKDGNAFNFMRVFRPLFPHFVPEDMYQLRRNDTANPDTVNANVDGDNND
jgi:prepilin-type N-terminal cleavage/methylation domain-containing protein